MLDRVVAAAAAVVTRTEPPRLFTELGRHPRFFRSWLPLGAMLLLRGELARRDTEVVVLRTAWNCRCRYEWVQHAGLAERAGVDQATIAAVADGPGTPGLSAHDRLLLTAVDELHRDRVMTDTTHRQVAAALSERQMIELCALVGHYEMLAMILKTRRTTPEPTALRRLRGRVRELADLDRWHADRA